MSNTSTNTEKQLSIYQASKLFTHLCVRDESLYGFKLVSGKMTIFTSKGYYDVKMLVAASNYDDCTYIKFRGVIYKYDPNDKQYPWDSVCYA